MQLYKTFDPNGATVPVWTSARGDASKAATTMKAQLKEAGHDHRDVEYKAVDVQPNKQGLLTFLNSADAK